MPEVEYKDNGTVILSYMNQTMDITDKFKDGYCFVELDENGTTQYVTVKYKNGYAMNPYKYTQPEDFN